MIAFTGQGAHKIKIKNKPIPEGFKVWILAFGGFVHDWLWHSGRDGPEECSKIERIRQVPYLQECDLPPTQLMPINLCKKLRDRNLQLNYVVILDNLFLNVKVAHVLLKYRIGYLGTTRKNADGIPQDLIDAKNKNYLLQWGEDVSTQVGNALCFLWQDNNAVLGVTTSFSLHREQDHVVKTRKRPKKTSTNAAIVWPAFEGNWQKDLPIPTLIDVYNHHMNGVDLANQLRHSFSCQLPQEQRWWRPIAYWLFDICANNAYIIWQRFQSKRKTRSRRLHPEFQGQLIRGLLAINPDLPIYDDLAKHTIQRLDSRRHCAWGTMHPQECAQGDRIALGEVVNSESRRQRSRQVHTVCVACDVALCIDRACFNKWHASLCANY